VGLNVFVPLFYSGLILRGFGFSNIALHICLGEEYKIFFHEKWTPGTFFETSWSLSLTLILGKVVDRLGTP
jgi:hypothetical protein